MLYMWKCPNSILASLNTAGKTPLFETLKLLSVNIDKAELGGPTRPDFRWFN